MPPYAGLLVSSLVLIIGGALFYIASVAGIFWPKATPPADLGLTAMTIVLLGLGGGGLLLRAAKLHPGPTQ
jgi:hypothetical protein